jgi:enterobacteria phage integrase
MCTHSAIAPVVCDITPGATESVHLSRACLGSGEFMDAYSTLLSNRPQDVELRPTAAPKIFAALAIRYYGSPQYQSLSAASRTNYRRVIDGFLEQQGHRRVDQMTREHVDIIIGKMANKPGAGITLLKRIRTLIRYAMALGWTDRDPTAGVKGYKSKEIHTWNEGEISVFEQRWPEGTRERLTFALLLYTGQRGSDVYRMTWADIVGDTIRVAQQKTAAKLTITIHEALDRVLSTANRGCSSILATAFGERFSVKGFGQMISTAIREAGLPERCKAHGLRKAAARRLAEAGCSASEIAAITGHKTLAEIERYTRAADQARLARQAIQRQSANRSGKPLVDEVANTTTEALEINSLIARMALPREARRRSKFNALRNCLGKKRLIVFQGVLEWPPKRLSPHLADLRYLLLDLLLLRPGYAVRCSSILSGAYRRSAA